jgi:hypothetical protein
MTAREEGRSEEALELLRFALEADPDAPDLALAFFETAAELGRSDEGVAILAPVIWREVSAGEREAAVSHWRALCERGERVWAEPPLLLRLAGWLRDAGEAEAASSALRCALDGCSGDPVVAMRVARLARPFDPVTALEAAEAALETPGLEPAEPVGAPESEEKEEPESFEPSIRRTLRVKEAVPLQVDQEVIWLDVEGKGRIRLPLSRVDAVAAVGVHGLSHKAVILIDLALDWSADRERPLRVLRLRSDRYDPRTLVGDAVSPLEAIGQFVSTLITGARALPLPDPESAHGHPFRIFRDLAGYEGEVLCAQRPAVDEVFQVAGDATGAAGDAVEY